MDVYGVKGKIRLAEINDKAPETWKDVGQQLNRSLMKAVDQAGKLVADTPTAVRSLLKGLAAMPASLASRVSRAHRTADELENQTQQDFIQGRVLPSPPKEIEDKLEEWILRKRADGWSVVIEPHVDGGTLIAVVRPELEDYARALARQSVSGEALPPMPD